MFSGVGLRVADVDELKSGGTAIQKNTKYNWIQMSCEPLEKYFLFQLNVGSAAV